MKLLVETGFGVTETEQPGMQELTLQAVDQPCQLRISQFPGQAWIAVQRVTDDRMACGRQMNADLMGSPGLQFKLQQTQPIRLVALQGPPMGHCVSAVATAGTHLLPVYRMPSDRLIDLTGRPFNQAMHQGTIAPLDGMLFELPGQLKVGMIVLGRNHDARGISIEPMDDTGSQLAANPGEVIAMMQQGVDQRAAWMTGSRMDNHAGGFIDNNQAGILIKNRQGDRLRRSCHRSRVGQDDRDSLTPTQLLCRFCLHAVQQHCAILDQALYL